MNKIMIVSEQPKNDFEYIRKDPFQLNIDKCEGEDNCWGCIKPNNKKPCSLDINTRIIEKKKSSFLETMKVIFEKLQNFTYYWTHYVKCPGYFREKGLNYNFNINACADKWLGKEIKHFEPDKIITLGEYAGLYLLGKPIDKFKKIVGVFDLTYKYNKDIKMLLLYHPSGNSRMFNEWRKNNHKKLLEVIGEFIHT